MWSQGFSNKCNSVGNRTIRIGEVSPRFHPLFYIYFCFKTYSFTVGYPISLFFVSGRPTLWGSRKIFWCPWLLTRLGYMPTHWPFLCQMSTLIVDSDGSSPAQVTLMFFARFSELFIFLKFYSFHYCLRHCEQSDKTGSAALLMSYLGCLCRRAISLLLFP